MISRGLTGKPDQSVGHAFLPRGLPASPTSLAPSYARPTIKFNLKEAADITLNDVSSRRLDGPKASPYVLLDFLHHPSVRAEIASVVQTTFSSVEVPLDGVECVLLEEAMSDTTNQKLLGFDTCSVLYHPDLDTRSARTYDEL